MAPICPVQSMIQVFYSSSLDHTGNIFWRRVQIEVRDSPERDIWFLHVVLLGSYQMGRVLGTPPPPPSSGKCPNMRKCALFHKWACPKNPEMLISGKKKKRRRPNVEQSYLEKIDENPSLGGLFIEKWPDLRPKNDLRDRGWPDFFQKFEKVRLRMSRIDPSRQVSMTGTIF